MVALWIKPINRLCALEVSNSAKSSLGKEAKDRDANYISSLSSSGARVLKYNEGGSVNEKANNVEDENSDEEEEEEHAYSTMGDAEDVAIKALKIGSTLDNFEPMQSIELTSSIE